MAPMRPIGAIASAPALLVLSASAAIAQEAVMKLAVAGGGSATDVVSREGERVSVDARTVEALGLAAPHAGAVALNEVAGLTYRIDEAAQQIDIICAASCFPGHALGAPNSDAHRPPLAPPLSALALNYDVSASDIAGRNTAGGLFEGVYSGARGVLASSVLAEGGGRVVRLDTNYQIDAPHQRLKAQLGDTISTAGVFGGPVRYAGVKFGTDFSLDPNFISFPTPLLGATATMRSNVDVYVDGALRQSRQTEAGPFSIEDAPYVSGAGLAQVVVTDMLGRERVISQPFYVAPKLLKPGLADFTADAGVRRNDYGLASDHYGGGLAALSYRRGFPAATLGLRAEASEEGVALGAAIAAAGFHLGEGEAGLALSSSDRGAGVYGRLGWSRVSRFWSASASIEGADAAFVRVGETPRATWRAAGALSVSDQAGGTATLSYAGVRDEAGAAATLSASYARSFAGGPVASVSLLRVLAPGADTRLSVGLSVPLAGGASAALGAEAENGRVRTIASFQRAAPGDGGWGWRAAAASDDRVQAALSVNARHGEGEVAVSRIGGVSGVRIGLRGTLAWIDGGAYLSRPLRGGFALVHGPPGAPIALDNRAAGRLDGGGKLLLTNLRAYDDNVVSLNRDDLPLRARLDEAAIDARPVGRGGARVDFQFAAERGHWVIVRGPDGALAPEGVLLSRLGDGADFFVGAQGKAYVSQTAALHVLTANLAGQSCMIDIGQSASELTCAP